ncbi:hypothetical protein FRB90_002453 [Tulasnella sp. 427]|nr:hypothetical protein FRB90_002453 [Tulasnella sp. 427]
MIPIRRSGRPNGEGGILTRDRLTPGLSGLPPPALASRRSRASGTGSGTKKTATFDDEENARLSNRVRVHWAKFKKRLGAGSALSESLIEVTETSNSESAGRRYVTGRDNNDDATEDEEVDEIVVDNQFWLDASSKSATLPSEKGAQTPEKSGASGTHGASGLTDGESIHEPTTGAMAAFHKVEWFYYRVRHALAHFFFTSFYDPASETQYKKETYWQGKGLAIWGATFILLNWILVCILISKENMIFSDKMFYYVICPCLAVPLLPIVAYDWPRRFPATYQLFMTLSVWSWAGYNLIVLELCGYYDPTESLIQCQGKEFVGVFYYTSAFPVIALFALGQNRLMAVIQAVLTVPLLAFVIRNRQTWIRNTLNFVIYMIFLVWVHYQREQAERRLHTMRDRLKVQYRATQQAQVRESKAADSKKRFSSYIFHEVRVPLNTALLALQNMQASGLLKNDDIEVTALEGSLTMMSKVLNDVLDFNRMDSGRFESVSKPYAFHKVIKGMLVPLQLTANARGLHLIIELDEQIDRVAKYVLHKARTDAANATKDKDKTTEDPEKTLVVGVEGITYGVGPVPGGASGVPLGSVEDEAALVVGDEHRLRQIVTNLTSNACKFTPTGGKIWVRTKLILPDEYNPLHPASDPKPTPTAATTPNVTEQPPADPNAPSRLSVKHLNMHNAPPGTTPALERIVVRIEVEDTGVGIRRKDMIDNRLFSPYVQTDIGRFQGGKGTGLGLALSKHIIRLSGGRLGVKSTRNQGSMFWVEMAVGVGRKVLEKQDMFGKDGLVAQNFELSSETTEAFNAPLTEDATPSTMLSTSDGSPHDVAFPAPPGQSANAMRELMEHSGEIELLPRNKQYIVNNTAIPAAATVPRPPPMVLQQPPAVLTPPASMLDDASSGLGSNYSSNSTAKPMRVVMPPPQISFSSASATSGSLDQTVNPFPPGVAPISVLPRLLEPPPTASTSATKPADSAKKPKPPASAASVVSSDPPLDVLVVDDDAMTRKLMERMLTRNGCIVQTAENGKDALDKIVQAKNPFTFAPSQPGDRPRRVQTPYLQEEEPKYDVVFLDNQMPVMSGVEMVRQLRGLKRKDFVVGVTGNALKEDQMEYLDAGVDAVLTKPVKEASLKAYLLQALEKKKAKLRAETHDPQLNPNEPLP